MLQVDNETYLTRTEVCNRLGFTQPTMNALVRYGFIKSYEMNLTTTRYYKLSDVATLKSPIDIIPVSLAELAKNCCRGVYALRDSSTKRIRYVGKGLNVWVRYGQHISDGAVRLEHTVTSNDVYSKREWISSLLERGLLPELVILEVFPTAKKYNLDGYIREQWWILRLFLAGEILTNVQQHSQHSFTSFIHSNVQDIYTPEEYEQQRKRAREIAAQNKAKREARKNRQR